MNVLPEGSEAPELKAVTLTGEAISSEALSPLLVSFAMPDVHASRLVVGYLRRLKEQLPELALWIILQGDEAAVRRYAQGYLETVQVVHDADLSSSRSFAVTHVPSTYYLEDYKVKGHSVKVAFTGFSRPGLNRLAALAAQAKGTKAKELVTASDNKGEYELAERALSLEDYQP